MAPKISLKVQEKVSAIFQPQFCRLYEVDLDANMKKGTVYYILVKTKLAYNSEKNSSMYWDLVNLIALYRMFF